MPRIKMLRTEMGSDNGTHTTQYIEGKTYTVGASLRRVFVDQLGIAEDVEDEEPKAAALLENKAAAPLKNKAAKKASKKKARSKK